MFRYLMLVLASTSVLLTACGKEKKEEPPAPPIAGKPLVKGDFPNEMQTVFGAWQAPDELENGVFVAPRLYINRTSVGLEVNCRRGADKVAVSFAVQARVTGDTIEILESATRTGAAGEIKSCSGQLAAAKYLYYVNGNSLTLETANKARLLLDRIF